METVKVKLLFMRDTAVEDVVDIRPVKNYIKMVIVHFKSNTLSEESKSKLLDALETVWKQKEGQVEQDAKRISHKLDDFKNTIRRQVEAATDPDNVDIKQEILDIIAHKKEEVSDLGDKLQQLKTGSENDKTQFLSFAFEFVENMGTNFLKYLKKTG